MRVIGLDLGGTKLAGAVYDSSGQRCFQIQRRLGTRTGREVGKLTGAVMQELMIRARTEGPAVSAVGVSIPGIYTPHSGCVWAPNIPGWDRYPLLEELQEICRPEGMEVRIDSDRACSILGEVWQGAARGCRHAVFVAVGTGIGAGILIDGQVLRGQADAAGATGWMALERPYRPEYKACGCFEYQASGAGLVRVTRELLEQDPDYQGELRRIPPATLTARQVFRACRQGDGLAARVLDNAIQLWGMAAANYVSLFNPETIIFGGGVFGPGRRFLGRIRREARRWAQPVSIRQVRIEATALKGTAALAGAARLALPSV